MATAAHHPPMRSFLSLLARLSLLGALGLAAGCGPQEAFCPNTGVDGGPVCPINGDDGMVPTMDMGGGMICPTGQQLGDNPDGNTSGPNGGLICVCKGTGTVPPCQ
jgi:hypothetical protein